MATTVRFEWDEDKNRENQQKHGTSFDTAQYAFADPKRVIAEDLSHSRDESRYYCFGQIGSGIMTVRFTYSGPNNSDHRRRLLAERKANL